MGVRDAYTLSNPGALLKADWCDVTVYSKVHYSITVLQRLIVH